MMLGLPEITMSLAAKRKSEWQKIHQIFSLSCPGWLCYG